MKRYLQYGVVILFSAFITNCKSVSKYTIDEKPVVKIDTNLLGIWKAVEDTDKTKRDYFCVQSYQDIRDNFRINFKHLGNKEKIDSVFKSIFPDYNEKKDVNYFITYMDHYGQNPHYQQWDGFLSNVGKLRFLNIGSLHGALEGFFFVRIININATHDRMVTAIVADTTLKSLTSSEEVRNRIEKNLNNPSFYSDTVHFYKVSGYHLSLNESKLKAN